MFFKYLLVFIAGLIAGIELDKYCEKTKVEIKAIDCPIDRKRCTKIAFNKKSLSRPSKKNHG